MTDAVFVAFTTGFVFGLFSSGFVFGGLYLGFIVRAERNRQRGIE